MATKKIIFWLLSCLPANFAYAEEELILSVGRQKLITENKKINRVALGDPSIVRIKSLKGGKEILITGKAPGNTDLILWYGKQKKRFTLHVLAKDTTLLKPRVKQFLRHIEGVQLRRMGDKLVIKGRLLRPVDRYQVRKLANSHPLIEDMTRMDERSLEITLNYIQKRLQEQNYHGVSLARGGETLFVEGTVASESDLKRLKSFLSTIYPDVEYGVDTTYGSGEMIFMDIKMVEIRKNALLALGIAWQQSLTVNLEGSLASSGNTATLALAEAIPITLHTLQAKGLARVLSNPKLSCRFDVACDFHAGGEVPISLIGERTAQVVFKKYGVQISLTPHQAKEDRLLIDIDIEFSDIDLSTAVNGVPGLLKNNVKTTASVRYNNSVVLSGLINRRDGKSIRKLPLLGSMPILGELFKSRSFNRAESEFLLFLTPYPIIAGDSLSKEMIEQTGKQFDRVGKKIPFKWSD